MSLNAADTAKAKEIVDQLVWQPAEGHNYRYTRAVNTLTRFCEAASMEPDVAKLVIEYLKDEVITDGISLLNKRMDFGTGWKAMDAWYQTAAGEKFAGTESTKVRIFQVLMQPPADGDTGDGPYLVEDGCQYKVSHTFYWNVEELPELDESSSGIQYTMQGITRDSVTGLYSCVIEERERVQQDVPLYDSAKTIFETVQEEQHLGVKAADVPTIGQAASASGGVLVKRQISKNPDCTSDVRNEVTTEHPVSSAVVRVEKTWEGIIRTTKNRNQANPAAEPEEMKPGSSITNEKTPGGRYDQTIVEADETPLGVKGRDCEKTIFEHRDTVTENTPNDPGEQHGSAANGTIVVKSSAMTRFGTWDVKQITLVEQPVSDSVVQYRKTLRGTIETTTNRNQTNPLTSSGISIGETRRSEKTPGGLYNNTTETTTTDAAGKIVDGVEKETVRSTAFEINNQKTNPGEITLTAEVNKTKRKVVRANDAGTYDVDTQETDYVPVQNSKTWVDERGTHVYCSYRNQTQPLTPAAPTSGTWDQTSVSFSENDHGSFDGSYSCFQVAAPSGTGKTLQYETEANVSTKFYYQKAGGEMVYRNITGTRHLAYGLAKHIMSEIKNAEECSLVGWRTKIGDGPGVVSAHWYTGISVGAESKISSGSQGA